MTNATHEIDWTSVLPVDVLAQATPSELAEICHILGEHASESRMRWRWHLYNVAEAAKEWFKSNPESQEHLAAYSRLLAAIRALIAFEPAASQRGFARTPPILRGAGPQMEDYADWDSWYFARQVYVMENMGGSVDPRMKKAAEKSGIKS